MRHGTSIIDRRFVGVSIFSQAENSSLPKRKQVGWVHGTKINRMLKKPNHPFSRDMLVFSVICTRKLTAGSCKNQQLEKEFELKNPSSHTFTHPWKRNLNQFQVPKMEVLNLIRLFWGWVFPYISLTSIQPAYITVSTVPPFRGYYFNVW